MTAVQQQHASILRFGTRSDTPRLLTKQTTAAPPRARSSARAPFVGAVRSPLVLVNMEIRGAAALAPLQVSPSFLEPNDLYVSVS